MSSILWYLRLKIKINLLNCEHVKFAILESFSNRILSVAAIRIFTGRYSRPLDACLQLLDLLRNLSFFGFLLSILFVEFLARDSQCHDLSLNILGLVLLENLLPLGNRKASLCQLCLRITVSGFLFCVAIFCSLLIQRFLQPFSFLIFSIELLTRRPEVDSHQLNL